LEWCCSLLDEVAHRGSGHTPSKSFPEYWNGGIKWISLADCSALDRVYISDTENHISGLGVQNSSAVIHPPGIVVLSRDAGVGKSAITTDNMAVSQHFMCWQPGPRLNTHYLYYWLQYRKRDFENIATGSTIPTIGLRFFKKYKICVPKSIVEQRKIGLGLLNVDLYLFSLEKHLAKLRRIRSGLMNDLLNGYVSVRVGNSQDEIVDV
jgi:type I restriction enzyme S subunit